MAKHINIKNEKTQLFGRAPKQIKDKHSDEVKNLRYYKYLMLYNHYHPHLNQKRIIHQPVVERFPIITAQAPQTIKNKWFIMPHWIVELFTREDTSHEILSGTVQQAI